MKRKEPSSVEWKELFAAAKGFAELQPWRWVSDQDIFAVKNPEGGETGYCCVMGAGGEVFGLVVYLGAEGLHHYLKIVGGAIEPEDPENQFSQKCLVVTFEDRSELDRKDLATIKGLGLKFRGRNAWPHFRSHLPGYAPWYLAGDEVRFLTSALVQTVQVAVRLRMDPNMLHPPNEERFFARVLEKRGSAGVWTDTWVDPEPWEPPREQPPPLDELRLKRISKDSTRKGGVWELDSFYFPGIITEGERPYFAHQYLVLDHANGIVLHFWLSPPWEGMESLQENLLGFFVESRGMPKTIYVAKEELHQLLVPLAARLKISLKLKRRLPFAEMCKMELYSRFFGV